MHWVLIMRLTVLTWVDIINHLPRCQRQPRQTPNITPPPICPAAKDTPKKPQISPPPPPSAPLPKTQISTEVHSFTEHHCQKWQTGTSVCEWWLSAVGLPAQRLRHWACGRLVSPVCVTERGRRGAGGERAIRCSVNCTTMHRLNLHDQIPGLCCVQKKKWIGVCASGGGGGLF